jgi:hypothetical protein
MNFWDQIPMADFLSYVLLGHSAYNNTGHFWRSQVEKLANKSPKSISCHIESSIMIKYIISQHLGSSGFFSGQFLKFVGNKTRHWKITFLPQREQKFIFERHLRCLTAYILLITNYTDLPDPIWTVKIGFKPFLSFNTKTPSLL